MINLIKASIKNVISWNSMNKFMDIEADMNKLDNMKEDEIINLSNEIIANREEFLRKTNYNTFLKCELENLEHLLLMEKKMIRRIRKNRYNNYRDDIISIESLVMR